MAAVLFLIINTQNYFLKIYLTGLTKLCYIINVKVYLVLNKSVQTFITHIYNVLNLKKLKDIFYTI